MRGLKDSRRGQRDETVNEPLFGGEVNSGWFTGDDTGDGFGIFRRRKLPGKGGRRISRFLASLGMTIGLRAFEQDDDMTGIAEGYLQSLRSVLKNAKNTDNR